MATIIQSSDLDFDTTYLTISGEEKANSKYFYADKSIIVTPPAKEAKLPDETVKFTITDKLMKSVLQAAGVLQLPEVVIKGDGEHISINAMNVKNKTSNSFYYNVGNAPHIFEMIFKVENLKLMMAAYDVTISKKGITEFLSTDKKLKYMIVNETNSTFTK